MKFTVTASLAFPLAVAALSCALAHAADNPEPTRATLAKALNQFLAERGEICVAKYDWPIDVSARDEAAKTRDAVQMPVLERQGLVTSREGYVVYNTDGTEEKVPTRRYELTEAGRRYYKAHEVVLHPHGGPDITHHQDLCAGHLDLDTIVQVVVPDVPAGIQPTAHVNYLYRFTPEPWVKNEQVLRVFPMVEMMLQGQGKLEMHQSFHFDGRQWVADTALE